MRKQFTIRGKQVDVEDVNTTTAGSPAKLLRATVGSIIVERTHTFGAVDGPRPLLTAAQVQKDLDDARQKIAEEAVWQEELSELLGKTQ